MQSGEMQYTDKQGVDGQLDMTESSKSSHPDQECLTTEVVTLKTLDQRFSTSATPRAESQVNFTLL